MGKDPRRMIAVNVPAKAKPGQAMLVPVPADVNGPGTYAAAGAPPAVEVKARGRSTGCKVAMGITGAVVVGGLAVGGGVLGMYAAEHGVDATGEMLGEGATTAADAVTDFAEDAFDITSEGLESAGDFIMDLF